MPAASSLRLRTGAKLNLFLRVLGRRSDGYHELESVFHSLDFADDLEVRRASSGELTVTMESETTPGPLLPQQEENLVYIAARRLQEVTGIDHGASIHITKRIPIAGGLGGGSSNAAGALRALDELWGLGLERTRMLEIAAEVGSDVPFCLFGGRDSLVTGRGEKLAPLPGAQTPLWFVLGISNEPLLTADVYAGLNELARSDPGVAPLTLALADRDVAEVARLLHNDLEPVALRLRPDLKEAKDLLVEAGALGAAVSGSGPTVFGIASDEPSAHTIAEAVDGRFDRVVAACSGTACVSFV